MQAALGDAVWGGVFVRFVIRRTKKGARFVVEGAGRDSQDEKSALLAQRARETLRLRSGQEWGTGGGGIALERQCQVSTEGQNFDDSTGSRQADGEIPWLCAAVDPCEKWWLRLRGNPKRAGEISQAAFLLKAEMMGFDVALPWGDNQKFDFVVWQRDGRAVRVQVKGTGRLHRRGYEVQPVHTTRGGGKKRYTKKDIDVIAAHVQPVDAWYLIPIEKVGRAKSLRLYPGIEVQSLVRSTRRSAGRVEQRGRRWQRVARWERWRDAWDVIAER